jgi:site-specific recombinase XerD
MKISRIAQYCAYDENGQMRVSKATFKSTYKAAASQLIQFLGDMKIEDVTPSQLIAWQEWLDSRDITKTTRNSYVRAARAMFNHMIKTGMNVCDPHGILFMRKTRPGIKSINEDDAWRMVAFSGIREAAMIWLAMDSARRRGGLADLQIDKMRILFDDKTKQYRMIGYVEEKGEKEQLFMAGHHACLALLAWLEARKQLLKILDVEDHGYVFVSLQDGQPLSTDYYSWLAAKVRRSAQIPADRHASLHAFRHRQAKELLKRGVSIPEVRDILGHESAELTLDMYARFSENELIDAYFNRDNGKEKNGRFHFEV